MRRGASPSGSVSSASAVKPGSAWSASRRSASAPGPSTRIRRGGMELVAQVVPHRHEVDEVVRVEMADDHRREVRGRDVREEPGERSLAQVEEHVGGALGDQVAGSGGALPVGVRRARAQHRQPHATLLIRTRGA